MVTGALGPLGAWGGGDMGQRISSELELRAMPEHHGMKMRAST